jgi:phosphopantothenoylcysteine decarboxylase/phosphopantothenate--cysteine ligase
LAIDRLRNKKILITAGSTWVPIDRVRVISNIATGATGILLTARLRRLGAKVKLILGPFELGELERRIKKELKSTGYDIVIHSAAVVDYQPKRPGPGKIRSGIKNLKLELVPTRKLINAVKRFSPKVKLVGFKFEPRASDRYLVVEARKLMRNSASDLVVANTYGRNGYKAFIVSPSGVKGPYYSKRGLAINLVKNL